jgi:uncharacterized protein (DUF2141 family)
MMNPGTLLLPLLIAAAVLYPSGRATGAPPTVGAAELAVLVTGLRNGKGKLSVAVFDRALGFPQEDERAVYRRSVELAGRAIPPGGIEVLLPEVEAGRYALIVLHDENGNGKLDKNFLGMPTEGYGVSNDARNRFGPPKFTEAVVEVGATTPRLDVRVHY